MGRHSRWSCECHMGHVFGAAARSCNSCALLTDFPSNDTKYRCELKRRKAGLSRGLISINYKACTMTCMDEVINLTAPTL